MWVRRLAVMAAVLAVGIATADTKRETSHARMQSDLQFLTSDDCEGRGPGTKGIDRAADHIAQAFREAGLKPAMKDDSYFQPFSLRGPATPAKAALSVEGPGGLKLHFGEKDAVALGLSGNGHVMGEMVFIGYSTVAEKVPYDDFAGIDIEGKIVVMLRRCPRYSGEKKFGDDDTARNASALNTKLANAEKRKAAAVLMINDRSQIKESGDVLSAFGTFSFGTPAKIPAMHIRRDLGDALVSRGLGKTLEELETEIDRDLKPQSAVMKDCTADVDVTIDRDRKIAVKNVIGVLEGSGPLANETILVGAHYDHLGYGGRGSLDRNAKSSIHYGADDNASGTTTMIELARRFAAMKDRAGRRLVFMAFSGEELGLLGSAHYCKEPVFPLENTAAMVNLDMVGRLVPDAETKQEKIEIGGTGTAKTFDALVDKHNAKPNFKIKKSASGMGPSDHQSFYLKNLPVLFLFTGLHQDYHKPTDTWDKINIGGMIKIADMAEGIVAELVEAPRPEFTKTAGPAMRPTRQTPGAKVRLGVMPDYNDEGEGMLLQGVVDDGLAAKAGLKGEDRVIEIAGQPVKNVAGYMTAMEKVEPGKEFEIVILRKKEKMTFKIKP